MLNNKFIVGFALGVSLQSYAMEQVIIASELEIPQFVHNVILQVRPGFIPGTRIVKTVRGEQSQKHDQALSALATLCKARGLTPINDLGVYHISFCEPQEYIRLLELCKSLPGFEKLHVAEGDERAIYETKTEIFQERLEQLDKWAARSTNEGAKLSVFKKLSTSQMLSKLANQETNQEALVAE